MREWHLYARIGLVSSVQVFPSWISMRETIIRIAEQQLDRATAATIRNELLHAVQDQPWSCAGAGCQFKLRPLHTHAPLKPEELMSSTIELNGGDESENGEHAELGASTSDRWMNCAGSLHLIRKLIAEQGLQPSSSIYAKEGTAAHKLGHLCLLQGSDAIELIDRSIKVEDTEFMVDDEMATAIQVYLDKCREYVKEGNTCFTERRLSLKKLSPPAPMFGTCDFGAIIPAEKKLVIVDLKYGKGVTVKAQDNPQIKYYALLVLCALPKGTAVETVETIVVQPRGIGAPIKTAVYKMGDILDWHMELLAAAKATMEPDAPLKAGSWCRFCPASGRCSEQAKTAYEEAQAEFAVDTATQALVVNKVPEIRMLTPAQLGLMLTRFPLIEEFMKAAKAAVKDMIEAGVDVPYWRLAAGEGHRKWTATEPYELEKLLTARFGLSKDEVYKTEVISPKGVEDIAVTKMRAMGMKAKDAVALVKAELTRVTIRPETASALVSTASERPAPVEAESQFEYEQVQSNSA